MKRLRSLSSPAFWLLGLTASFIAIHLSLVWHTLSPSFLAMSLLFWLSALALVWNQRQGLNLKTGVFASLLGTTLLALLLLLISTAITGDNFVRVYPFLAALGLALLASGFQGLRQYWQPLVLLFFLGIPEVLLSYSWLSSSTDISAATARLSTVMLWYSGFNVVRQGVNIYLPGGSVEVYPGCSGLELMMQLLGLSVLVLILLPLRWTWVQKIGLPLVAMAIAFIVNGVRVALMAILVAQGQKGAFDYWHNGTGSLLFSGIAVLLFVFFVQWILQQHTAPVPESVENEPS
jgi:cyanoexosortase A